LRQVASRANQGCFNITKCILTQDKECWPWIKVSMLPSKFKIPVYLVRLWWRVWKLWCDFLNLLICFIYVWYKNYAPHWKYFHRQREIHSTDSFCRTRVNPAVSQISSKISTYYCVMPPWIIINIKVLMWMWLLLQLCKL
jgi:hypothetical protein